MKSRIYIILLSVFLSACISDYNPSGIDELSNLLVVEGTITDGTTVIRLSKSVGLTEDINTAATVHDAQVSVECSDGTIYHAIEYLGDGKYSIKTGTLNTDIQYRLRIKLDGLEYESEYLNPLKTLPIDKIYWKKENNGSEIAIFLSTLINKDQTLYYKYHHHLIHDIFLYWHVGQPRPVCVHLIHLTLLYKALHFVLQMRYARPATPTVLAGFRNRHSCDNLPLGLPL